VVSSRESVASRHGEPHLFAQVVVDAEELALAEVRRRELVELLERGRVAAEGLLDHQPCEAAACHRGCAHVARDHLCDGAEDGRRHGEEEEPVAWPSARVRLLARAQQGVQLLVGGRRVVAAGVEGDPTTEVRLTKPRVALGHVHALLGDKRR